MGDFAPLRNLLTELASKYGPAIVAGGGTIAAGAGRAELRRQARRLINIGKRMIGMEEKVGKFKYKAPRYRKGYERLTGVYGRFKPEFGKELKFFDTNVTADNIPDEWSSINFVHNIPKETGPSDRIGRRYTIKSLQMRLNITKRPNVESVIIRIIIVLDKQTNGEFLTGDQLFVAGATQGPTTWSKYRNLENLDRFEILWDKTYHMDATSGTNAAAMRGIPATTIADSYFKRVNIPILVAEKAGSPSIADVATNSVHVMYCSNEENLSDISYDFRVRFTG